MQDWNYVHTNCFEVTVEMNCVKYPLARELRPLWDEHKYSLIAYIEQVRALLNFPRRSAVVLRKNVSSRRFRCTKA
jgi:hypothetical protein